VRLQSGGDARLSWSVHESSGGPAPTESGTSPSTVFARRQPLLINATVTAVAATAAEEVSVNVFS
jgi:hypothetical protein